MADKWHLGRMGICILVRVMAAVVEIPMEMHRIRLLYWGSYCALMLSGLERGRLHRRLPRADVLIQEGGKGSHDLPPKASHELAGRIDGAADRPDRLQDAAVVGVGDSEIRALHGDGAFAATEKHWDLR